MRLFFISLLFYSLSFAQDSLKEKPLNVAIGIDEIVKFDYKYNVKVQIGNPSLIKLILAPSKQEITFRGLKAGKTSVTIRDAVGDIRDKYIVSITSDGNSNTVRELRELIGDVEGVEIKIKGGKVIVDGNIVVPNDIGRVMTVLSKYPDVLILLEYADQTKIIVARKMQEMINRNGMKDVTVRVVNGDYWLEGVVNSSGKKELANELAKAYLPDVLLNLGASSGGERFRGNQEKGMSIMNFVSVNEKKDPEPPAKLVKISAQFVELAKDYQRVFAFKWSPFMATDSQIAFGKVDASNDNSVSTSENGSLSGVISRLFPKLNAAKSAGYARVIQSGMVVTNEGKPVTIAKSSQIDFAVGTGEGQTAQTASVTFELKTTPRIGVQENVSLDGLSIQVSLPNGTNSSQGARVTTNSINTNITVKSKESAVVGGIIQTNSATEYDKDDPDQVEAQPGEGSAQTSALFNVLRSKKYGTTKSQFVMFVTPEILESASKGTEEIRRKFRKRER